MNSNTEKVVDYLMVKHHLHTPRTKIIELLENSSDNNISDVCEIFFGLSIKSLYNISKSTKSSSDYIDNNEKIKLYDTINRLSLTISNLETEISELRDNYWKLNQSIIKKTNK